MSLVLMTEDDKLPPAEPSRPASDPPPDRPSRPASAPEPPAPAPSKPRAGIPLAGGWPQALVLICALASVTVLAATGTISGEAVVLLIIGIAGAAGAFASAAKGRLPPSGGTAVLVVAGLGALGAELLGRWRA